MYVIIVMTSVSTGLTSCNMDVHARTTGNWNSVSGDDTSVGAEFVDPFGSVAIILSWLTNLLTTSALSYKSW